MHYRRSVFTRIAAKAAQWTGNPLALVAALTVVLAWAITGPIFDYSDTWQLIINTGTSVITFLMVFLIQSAQNRDTKALQLKLDELLRTTEGAHTALMDLEELEEKELDAVRAKYQRIAAQGRKSLREGNSDEGKPEIALDRDLLDAD